MKQFPALGEFGLRTPVGCRIIPVNGRADGRRGLPDKFLKVQRSNGLLPRMPVGLLKPRNACVLQSALRSELINVLQ